MRFPIKINYFKYPSCLRKWVPGSSDPRAICEPSPQVPYFQECVSSIKIDSTWKSTKLRRHELTNALTIELSTCYRDVSILEIGASCGSTSLDLLNKLELTYCQYFVTDIYFSIPYRTRNSATYFYHPLSKRCIMRVSDHFVIYEDIEDAVFPMGIIAHRVMSQAPLYDAEKSNTALMLHPELRHRIESDPRILVKEYDVFDTWPQDPVNIIIAANVLNKLYFSAEQIKLAAANLGQALKIGGRLIVTDNRNVEKISVYIKTNASTITLEKQINGGSEASAIISEL